MEKNRKKYLEYLPGMGNGSIILVRVEDILYLKIEDGVIHAHLANCEPIKIKSYRSLDEVAVVLDDKKFFKPNRATICQIARIKKLITLSTRKHAVEMSDRTQIDLKDMSLLLKKIGWDLKRV